MFRKYFYPPVSRWNACKFKRTVNFARLAGIRPSPRNLSGRRHPQIRNRPRTRRPDVDLVLGVQHKRGAAARKPTTVSSPATFSGCGAANKTDAPSRKPDWGAVMTAFGRRGRRRKKGRIQICGALTSMGRLKFCFWVSNEIRSKSCFPVGIGFLKWLIYELFFFFFCWDGVKRDSTTKEGASELFQTFRGEGRDFLVKLFQDNWWELL